MLTELLTEAEHHSDGKEDDMPHPHSIPDSFLQPFVRVDINHSQRTVQVTSLHFIKEKIQISSPYAYSTA